MKKLTLIAAFMMITTIASAQEVGARWGDVTGGDVAVDAVFSLGKFSRVHGDISFGNGVGVDLLWNFMYRPVGGEALNWYAGVGPYAVFDDPFTLGLVVGKRL